MAQEAGGLANGESILLKTKRATPNKSEASSDMSRRETRLRAVIVTIAARRPGPNATSPALRAARPWSWPCIPGSAAGGGDARSRPQRPQAALRPGGGRGARRALALTRHTRARSPHMRRGSDRRSPRPGPRGPACAHSRDGRAGRRAGARLRRDRPSPTPSPWSAPARAAAYGSSADPQKAASSCCASSTATAPRVEPSDPRAARSAGPTRRSPPRRLAPRPRSSAPPHDALRYVNHAPGR